MDRSGTESVYLNLNLLTAGSLNQVKRKAVISSLAGSQYFRQVCFSPQPASHKPTHFQMPTSARVLYHHQQGDTL